MTGIWSCRSRSRSNLASNLARSCIWLLIILRLASSIEDRSVQGQRWSTTTAFESKSFDAIRAAHRVGPEGDQRACVLLVASKHLVSKDERYGEFRGRHAGS